MLSFGVITYCRCCIIYHAHQSSNRKLEKIEFNQNHDPCRREFDCTANRLVELPPELGKLRRLEKLKCSINRLASIPEEIGNCRLLRELIVSENSLSKLPDSLVMCQGLTMLRCQMNKLVDFPVGVAVIPTLKDINLKGNPVS